LNLDLEVHDTPTSHVHSHDFTILTQDLITLTGNIIGRQLKVH
jgi:hypothetical protein